MPESIRVASADEIPPGKIKGFVVKGAKVLVANVDGKFYAIGSVCTHLRGPLEKGTLDGGTVTCPWHGSKFDVSNGQAIRGPAVTSEPTYKVYVKGNEIMVEA